MDERPNSTCHENLFAALALPDGTRMSILNREFTHRRGAEAPERIHRADADRLLAALQERSGRVFPQLRVSAPPGAAWPT